MSLLEKAMAPHSSTLAWKIPWMEEPGRSMGSLRVGQDWATSLSCIGEGNGNTLQCSCLENPRDGGAWGAAVYGVAQSRTWLKRLSSNVSLWWSWVLNFCCVLKLQGILGGWNSARHPAWNLLGHFKLKTRCKWNYLQNRSTVTEIENKHPYQGLRMKEG